MPITFDRSKDDVAELVQYYRKNRQAFRDPRYKEARARNGSLPSPGCGRPTAGQGHHAHVDGATMCARHQASAMSISSTTRPANHASTGCNSAATSGCLNCASHISR